MNEKAKILLVEDEENLATSLEFNLELEGYEITRAADGEIALDFISGSDYDLIILDIMLPYHDGFEIAEVVRKKSPRLPILMLTARTAAKDRIRGLESGADDYLTKPFHLKELMLRVKGMLKRKEWYQEPEEENQLFLFDNNEINFQTLNCKSGIRTFRLTPREALVMKYLVNNQHRIVSREELLENVWNLNPEIETRTVDNFIARLRKYFEKDHKNPRFIKSIRGAGYKFEN